MSIRTPYRITLTSPIGVITEVAQAGALVHIGDDVRCYAASDMRPGTIVYCDRNGTVSPYDPNIFLLSADDGEAGFTMPVDKNDPSHWKEVEKLANLTAANLPWWKVRKRFYWARVAGHAAGQRARILNGRPTRGLP